MDKKVITYKDPYGTVYKTHPLPVGLIEHRIAKIQEINDNKATIMSVQ